MTIAKKSIYTLISIILVFVAYPAQHAYAESYSRIGGVTRYSTAVAIANEYQPGMTKNIVLTTGDGFADALSVASFAHQLNAPILLSSISVEASSDSINYINTHTDSASTTYIIGGTGSVPESVRNALHTKIVPIGGVDRYATNLMVVAEMNVPKGTPLVFASGENYPDALSIAGFAARRGYPILLIGPQGLTPELNEYILRDSPTNMYFIGGASVLSLQVQATLASNLPNSSILRLAGNDRYDTAAAVNNTFAPRPSKVYITTGYNFADALAASSLAARDDAPLIYEEPLLSGAPLAMDRYLNVVYSSGSTPSIVALGGTCVSPDWIVSEISKTLSGTIPPALARYNLIGQKDFVRLLDFVPYAEYDIKYMTTDNFMRTVLYPTTYIPTVRKDMALRLATVATDLFQKGYRLKFWDAYRPPSAQQKMWNYRPDANYIANPSGWGSNHEHGGAVDVTLVDLAGNEVNMPTGFDDASVRASRNYSMCTQEEKTNALILQNAMKTQGFIGLSTEWWHFDDPDVRNNSLANNASPVELPSPEYVPQSTVTVSVTGDNTLANGYNFGYSGSFNNYYDSNDASYFYQYVSGILNQGDLSIGNLEGVLTTATSRVGKTAQGNQAFWFKGRPEYAQTLVKTAPYDAVGIANNHSKDYLDTGFNDTVDSLTAAGVGYFGYGHMYTTTRKGIKIAVLGYNVIGEIEQFIDPKDDTKLVVGRQQEVIAAVKTDIADAKSQGNQLVIVYYHWGTENNTDVDEYQTAIGHATVDAGANLVLGAHPHVIEPTEIYRGTPIVYSLGNFVFGGNYRPYYYNSEISQTTFNYVNGELWSTSTKSIPCLISSSSSRNNFQPVPIN